ncbi:MAG: hypothetical protein QOE90_497 [Thermoplasmata archaeon]|jgi:hypothetical protein|nr:hypothetical protein [Thermoplasmata archaeon]
MGRHLPLALATALLAMGIPVVASATARGAAATLARYAFGALAWLLRRQILPAGLSPGLLLVLGGVLVMGVVALVALFGSAWETGAPEAPKPRRVHTEIRVAEGHASDAYRGPRDLEFERGRGAGARVNATSLDAVLDRMVETEMGDPRITRVLPGFLKLNLYACRGCGREGPSSQGVEGCAFECGYLEGALGRVAGKTAIVHEVRCRNAGAPACEFEAWY